MKDDMAAVSGRLFKSLLGRRSQRPQVVSGPLGDTSFPGAAKSMLAIEGKGLFVIGAARSGTTVMQNALNDSREIFLFGEPVFHKDPGTPDFASRYNAMHRAWGNQENKSSFCPPLFAADASWQDYLCKLAAMHRHVGSKIVINPEHASADCETIFSFHCRHFYQSHYIFTFRNPVDVLMSTRGLAELNGDMAASYEAVLKSFVSVVALYIRMLRNLPHVTAVFHEQIGAATFVELGSWLDVDLASSAHYYDGERVRHYTMEQIPEHARGLASTVFDIYENLRDHAVHGFRLAQLEQNSGHFDIKHFTPLGALHRRVEQVLAQG
jgi:Sulfotransferase family